VADAVEVAFHRAASGLLEERAVVVVAVSGGGDSVALLHLMTRLSPRRRPDLVVAHLDHGLRRGSGADRRFVERLAASLGLPVMTGCRDVRAERRKDESLEEAARRVRRGFLLATARKAGADAVATGHTQDDQAETILMRLARGAGPAALAAMQPAGPGPFMKPLLGLERAALRAWLGKRGLAFRDDPSNESLAYDRNRVRRLIIPALAKALNPAAARHLVEAAARLRDDAMFLDAQAEGLFAVIATRRGSALKLDATALCALPRPLAARVARIALEAAGCDARKISARHVDAVVALASAQPGSSLDLPSRIVLSRREVLLEFRPCGSPRRS
jgi:tRNA(Ile)-lysidine synthase